MDERDQIKAWHDDEKAWWDKYGEYMTYQWVLTPALNKIIRTQWIKDFNNFLFCEEGMLLDLGCGGGWLSLDFARKGMVVLGLDISDEQIKVANNLKNDSGLGNLDFECTDLVGWDCTEYRDKFDSVFVNAFLHHLLPSEIEMIFKKISYVLKKDGKCYFYEPLTTQVKKRFCLIKFIDSLFVMLVVFLVDKIPSYFNLWSTRHRDELRKGYTMQSPHEAPVPIELIKRFLPDSLSVVEIRGWHLYSLGFCMQIMSLKESVRGLFTQIARLVYKVDHIVLSHFKWDTFARTDRFILCSIKLVKTER
jgi:2-polyprenyl-3-methyl-5-hydroxy-6-metoxy-1,4-benzoquinol methylase